MLISLAVPVGLDFLSKSFVNILFTAVYLWVKSNVKSNKRKRHFWEIT